MNYQDATFRVQSWANWDLRKSQKQFIRATIQPKLNQLKNQNMYHANGVACIGGLNEEFEAQRQYKGKSARVKFVILEETMMENPWFILELTYVFTEGFWEPY